MLDKPSIPAIHSRARLQFRLENTTKTFGMKFYSSSDGVASKSILPLHNRLRKVEKFIAFLSRRKGKQILL